MNNVFKNLPKEKRDRIINAALEEFAKNGFDKASSNQIVKKAKISKGILFHYFGSKKNLYDNLCKYTTELIKKKVADSIDWNEKDFFNRCSQIIILKTKLPEEYPYIYEFHKKIFEGKTQDEILKIAGDEAIELVQKIYTYNIDFSLFNDDLDKETCIDIIKWTFDGLSMKLWKYSLENKKDVDYALKESSRYIETLKKAFYKKTEEQND